MTTAVAAIQMVSGASLDENVATACRLIHAAADRGAQLVLLPEVWAMMGHDDEHLAVAEAVPVGAGVNREATLDAVAAGRLQRVLSDAARSRGIWIIGGSIHVASSVPGKVYNTTLVFDPRGALVARYDKIHLFSFANENESYDEAGSIVAGSDVVAVDGALAPGLGSVGLSICYDLRFPEMFRALGSGCGLIVVPSAFTHTTGAAHWEVLLRARAIENQCYVLAAAQGGRHANGRHTFGHSMLLDPWGEVRDVLADEGEGLVSGVLDAALLAQVRGRLPALSHRRM